MLRCTAIGLATALLSAGCARPPAHDRHDAAAAGADRTMPKTSGKSIDPAIIGEATMQPDGTLVLRLFRPAEATATYAPADPRYREVLAHLGGMRPGETKPVPAFPDRFDAARVEEAARATASSLGWKPGEYGVRIAGTDADGRVVVTLAAPPAGGKSRQLRVDPTTYAVVRVITLP
jgi:hypothetical protein